MSVLGITSYSSFGLGVFESMDIQVSLPLRYARYSSTKPIIGIGKIELAACILLLQEERFIILERALSILEQVCLWDAWVF